MTSEQHRLEGGDLSNPDTILREEGQLMAETPQLSDAKRALVEKYLRGDLLRGAPTVDSPAGHTGSKPAGSREGIVPIQVEGFKRPFFFLHGQWKLGGFFCFPLARALGADRPFYALEPYRFDGLPGPPSLETIAAAHVSSMRAIQPDGPYLLGGWCNGGLLAYEMARQLQAAGQSVDLLALMDPVYLAYPFRLRLIHRTVKRCGTFTGSTPERQLQFYLWLRQMYRYFAHVYRYFRYPDYRASKAFVPLEREDYPGIYDWTALDYKPSVPFYGKVTFIWSNGQPFRRGWRTVEAANEVEVDVLSCRHATCLDEHLDQLADRLRACLS